MFSGCSPVAFGGHRTLLHPSPGGTRSRIVSLRLHLHRCYRITSFMMNDENNSRRLNFYRSARGLATTTHSAGTVSDQDFAIFRDLLKPLGPQSPISDSRRNDVSAVTSLELAGARVIKAPAVSRAQLFPIPSAFQGALDALRQRDTRRLLIHLKKISLMREFDLQEAVAALPRTTFTEFLRSLDPLCVARYADVTGQTHVSVGMYQTLSMGDVIDDWGVRRLYSQLLQRMLILLSALKASGHILQTEEYFYLLRAAGAASDPKGAKWIWEEMVRTQTTDWRQSEAYAEFISARFLTRPLYTGYDKTRRAVTPRDLHRSRLLLHGRRVSKLDQLRFNTRLKRLRFGLNKDTSHTEDIMRMMRKTGPPTRLFHKLLGDGIRMNEPLLCAMMIAFGRVGSLRFISSRILDDYFGIHMTPSTSENQLGIQIAPYDMQTSRVAHRVRPTMRLMQAVVETYGSNGEIATAFALVDHISKAYDIPIPRSIWQDLLEWTYIMGSPPTSTAWKLAGMPSKIPSSSAIEVIWDTMTSAPYHVQPNFEQYNILIRNLLGRHRFGAFLPHMRRAVALYNAECREYEEVALEYVRMINDGVLISEAVYRYERARFKKEKMWYDIGTWCRQFLSSVRSFDPANPLPNTMVPDFIREFKPFITNPARYRTATGYVSLLDPARERPHGVSVSYLSMTIPMKRKRIWVYQSVKARRLAIQSSHSLAGHASIANVGLLTLLTSSSRTSAYLAKLREESEGRPVTKNLESTKSSTSVAESSYDDDDDW
ncbi:hypothetical protein GGR54DRAFT_386652 [Hypoxylon sp. NC1633]|nr:hypothetical protein GGR54DRAFT_386652 [Hypoxylon sp. NC1633]